MCVSCQAHLLADARLKDETATCPNCRCEISKSLCTRNLAVEKAISELPALCRYCSKQLPRSGLEHHESEQCQERCVTSFSDAHNQIHATLFTSWHSSPFISLLIGWLLNHLIIYFSFYPPWTMWFLITCYGLHFVARTCVISRLFWTELMVPASGGALHCGVTSLLRYSSPNASKTRTAILGFVLCKFHAFVWQRASFSPPKYHCFKLYWLLTTHGKW